MGKKVPLVIQQFDGGMSTDLKIGPENSFYYARHIDFRKSPTQLTILPKTVKETGTTVTGLITDMIQLPSGKIVAIDSSGGVYTRTTGASWSKNGTTLADTAMGMHYHEQHDTIYIAGLHNLHSITNADGKFSGGSFTVNENAITRFVDQEATTSPNTYTTTGAINEGATHKLSYTPSNTPTYSLKVWVTTKGTGDLIVTMHDAANNILGQITIANASLTNGALNEFIFTVPALTTVRPNAATYHFHIHHPSGTATTIGTSTASDFSTARHQVIVNRFMNPRNGMHPMGEFLQYILVGNGRYIAAWEPISQSAPATTELVQHRLVFPPGFETTSMADYTEYKAFACEKRSTSSTNEFQQGKIFFWDGTSQGYNFVLDVPEGAPYSLQSHKNVLYYFAGGGWYAWAGGDPVKLRQMPNTDTEFTDLSTYMVNYPHMLAVRNGVLLAGFPSETSSTTVEHGLYSFGARDRNFKESFGYSYTISTGTRTNGTLRIGCVRSFGDKLFIAWRDGSSYGVDVVDPNSDPFGTATWESLVTDEGRPDKEKFAINMFIDFPALPTGATVTPKYKINRGAWVTGTAATATATQVQLPINTRYKEIQLGFDLVATTTTPEIYGITLTRDLLYEEAD